LIVPRAKTVSITRPTVISEPWQDRQEKHYQYLPEEWIPRLANPYGAELVTGVLVPTTLLPDYSRSDHRLLVYSQTEQRLPAYGRIELRMPELNRGGNHRCQSPWWTS
jgi:hypothetical protein